jgi:Zn ribbon nucleic-acid-binding protein
MSGTKATPLQGLTGIAGYCANTMAFINRDGSVWLTMTERLGLAVFRMLVRRPHQGHGMSKQAQREEAERLIREAMEKKNIAVTKGNTRVEATCGKCGAKNRVQLEAGETRGTFECKDCGHKQKTL